MVKTLQKCILGNIKHFISYFLEIVDYISNILVKFCFIFYLQLIDIIVKLKAILQIHKDKY